MRGTLFRFQLVLRINVVAHEMLERETLIWAASTGQLAALASDDRRKRVTDEDHRRLLATLRRFTASRANLLLAAQEARAIAEGRYLGGHSALFPDDAARWPGLVLEVQRLAVMAYRLAELDGAPPPTPEEDAPLGTDTFVADLVEPPRAITHDQLDEGWRAFDIATSWLRLKAGVRGEAHAPIRDQQLEEGSGNVESCG